MADSTAATETAAKAVSAPATKAAVNRLAKDAVSAAIAEQTIPVVETVEMAMEVPAKVVLNQKLVVVGSLLGGVALGVGLMYGAHKLWERKLKTKAEKAIQQATEVIKTPPTA